MKNGANIDESAPNQVSASARILGYQRLNAAHLPAAEVSAGAGDATFIPGYQCLVGNTH
jgi:hypothetical protein